MHILALPIAQDFVDQGPVLDHEQMRVEDAGVLRPDRTRDFLLHLENLRTRGEERVLKARDLIWDFALFDPPQLVDRQLRPVVEDLDQTLDLDEIAAVEGIHDLGDVVPHLGVDLAGTVAQQQRKIRFARFLLAHVFPMHQESGREHLVGLEIA